MSTTDTATTPTTVVTTRKGLSWLATACMFFAFTVLGLVVWAFAWCGSIAAAVHFARGDVVLARSYSASCGPILPGQSKTVAFELTNHASVPIRFLGRKTTCSCTVPEPMPFTMQPGESRPFSVEIKINAGAKPEALAQPVTLYSNSTGQSKLELLIEGEIVNSASDSPKWR